ncbi:MAG TPA: hypothetical protein VMG34_08575 [Bacteroidota bacterium]|nr:hypothetical protein [Bacteroidota bacterium]
MNGNVCPNCGKPVMSYWRFVREAEPYKISKCGSCGIELKRSPKVYLFLAGMIVILAALSIPLFVAMAATRMVWWISWFLALLWLACWALVTNHLSWRYIGWVASKPGPDQAPEAAA